MEQFVYNWIQNNRKLIRDSDLNGFAKKVKIVKGIWLHVIYYSLILNPGILGDKAMDDQLYTPNHDKQNYHFCRSKLLV